MADKTPNIVDLSNPSNSQVEEVFQNNLLKYGMNRKDLKLSTIGSNNLGQSSIKKRETHFEEFSDSNLLKNSSAK